MAEPAVQVELLSKAYDGTVALVEFSLDLPAGEVHALVGENGAGKSTLIKILSGAVRPDRGSVKVQGKSLAFGDPIASEAIGVSVVHQEPTLFPDLGVEDNLLMGHEPRRLGFILDRTAAKKRCRDIMSELGEAPVFGRAVGELSLAHRQVVALGRALVFESQVVILDEPTASLTSVEAERLHALVRRLRDRGVAVLFVTHRLDEVFSLADRVTVMRDGSKVGTWAIGDTTPQALVSAMVGRELAAVESERLSHATGDVVLEAQGLCRDRIHEVSFSLRAGEILALAGIVGSGRTEVARMVAGLDKPESGEVLARGVRLRRGDLGHALQAGIAMVPEDRQGQGLVLPLSVRQNVVMAARPRMARRGWLRVGAELRAAEDSVKRLAIKTRGVSSPVSALSGGNQQKVVFAKWLLTEPRILILDEPTRGVDVGAKADIHRLVRSLAADGAGVLLVSSDLPEVLALSDRILVMREGRLVGEVPASEADQSTVMGLALGGGS